MREAHGNKQETYQYAVAVIKKGSLTDVNTLYNLRGKKACFAGAGTYAGWTRPLEIVRIIAKSRENFLFIYLIN